MDRAHTITRPVIKRVQKRVFIFGKVKLFDKCVIDLWALDVQRKVSSKVKLGLRVTLLHVYMFMAASRLFKYCGLSKFRVLYM